MKYLKYVLLLGLLGLFALGATGCRAGADGGSVGVVRNGGPFDNKAIKDCLAPAGHRKYIGLNSTVHYYPAQGVQRYFKITSDPNEGADYQAVVTAKSADGFNIHLTGTFYFSTAFGCDAQRKLTEDFDKQFGVRKFPDPKGGDDKAAWDGDRGWSSFLNAVFLPIIQNELRVSMLKFNCDEVVSSCSLVASRGGLADVGARIDKAKAKQSGVNLQKIQAEIENGFTKELRDTLGKDYFVNIKFLMSQPRLDRYIESKINTSLGAFSVVSQARAQVEQAKQQAAAAQNLAKVYKNNPALVELEKWRIICGTSTTTTGKGTTANNGGCQGVTIITGTNSPTPQLRVGK